MFTGRTFRPGAFSINDYLVRCADRDYGVPDFRDISDGFRVMSPGF